MKKIAILSISTVLLFGNSIEYLNSIRSSVGLNTLKPNSYLKDAALHHANYIIKNSINSHYEQESDDGFYGITPSSRAIKSGYSTKDIKENISVNAKNSKDSIDNLMSAIYHRFVFLDFAIDEIGEGISIDDKGMGFKSAYVYDIGLSKVSKLCQQEYLTLDGVFYMQNLCKDTTKYIPKDDYNRVKDDIAKTNPKMVLYPNKNQLNVNTAFFGEIPNPMPGYKVSGYPISVEINPAYFKDIKLRRFRLYDSHGRMVRAKLFKASNDPNDMLKPYQFAIIPLQRLDYDSKYSVYFEVRTDKGTIKQKWSFFTKKFNKPLYTITKRDTTINLPKSTDTIVLYIKPKNRKDIIKGLKFKGKAKVEFIDPNTIKVKDITTKHFTLWVDNKKINLIKE